MTNIPYVCLYRSYRSELALYTDEEVGRLVRALLDYLIDGTQTPLPERESLFWNRLRDQHDRDSAHYEKVCAANSENAKKRWKKSKGSDMPSHANDAKEKENEIEKEIEKDKEKEFSLYSQTRESFLSPSLDDVILYAKEAQLEDLDAQHFVDYYTSVGWVCGGKPMKDWRAMARMWDRRKKQEARALESMEGMYGDVI